MKQYSSDDMQDTSSPKAKAMKYPVELAFQQVETAMPGAGMSFMANAVLVNCTTHVNLKN